MSADLERLLTHKEVQTISALFMSFFSLSPLHEGTQHHQANVTIISFSRQQIY
jgi:hypothetical protein